MRPHTPFRISALAALLSISSLLGLAQGKKDADQNDGGVQLGPRPSFLVNDMDDGALKRQLKSCSGGPFVM